MNKFNFYLDYSNQDITMGIKSMANILSEYPEAKVEYVVDYSSCYYESDKPSKCIQITYEE